MIRPVDIQDKECTKAVRGYKEEEVNEFLDEITVDLERLLEERGQSLKPLKPPSRSWPIFQPAPKKEPIYC